MLKIRRDFLHWFSVAILIPVGILAGEWLDEREFWIKRRYQFHKYLQRADREVADVERTALVLIKDDEYWGGELARRVPIKRDYLAKLVRKLDTYEPAVIALDFDLRSSTPNGRFLDHADYRKETKEFLQTVREISRRRPIVLPCSVKYDPNTDSYRREAAIYDNFDFRGGLVRQGYIELPFDLRQIPLPLALRDAPPLDSFANAAVRLDNEKALHLATEGNDTLPYGSFVAAKEFEPLSSLDVLQGNPPDIRKKLAHKIVVIGAGWSRLAHGRGGQIDTALTPIGEVGKVFMHANYIEALLDQRTYEPISEKIAVVIEAVLALAMAFAFALEIRPFHKFLSFIGACALMVVLTYFLFQNLGLFFDFFIPLSLLALHAFIEQIIDWRRDAHKWWNHERGQRHTIEADSQAA